MKHRSIMTRLRILGVVVTLFTLVLAVDVKAQTQTFPLDIPSTDVSSALRAFARQAHQQVVFDGSIVRGKTSAPLKGTYTAEAAIRALLEGTGLSVRTGSKGEFQVSTAPASRSPSAPSGATDERSSADSEKPNLAEIIVTAQKKSELLQDVPVPVTVISAQTLTDNNELRLQDYYAQIHS